jgi:flagellar biosynthesis chaperone FliJ
VDGYYGAEVEENEKQQIVYQSIIKAVKGAIANYQADVKEVQEQIERIRENYSAEIRSLQTIVTKLKATRAIEAMLDREQLDADLQARLIERIARI